MTNEIVLGKNYRYFKTSIFKKKYRLFNLELTMLEVIENQM